MTAPPLLTQLKDSPTELSRRLENKEIARILWETADLMEIAGEDSFRIRSYRNGATAIEGYPERIADILQRPGAQSHRHSRASARAWPSVLQEIVDARLLRAPRRAAAEISAQRARVPQDPGPRARRASRSSSSTTSISTIDELERLCQEQKLRVLPRMGAKLEEKVLRSIAQYRQRTGRYLLSYAEDMARRADRAT